MAVRLFSSIYGVSELKSSRIAMSVRPPPKPSCLCRHVERSSSSGLVSKLSPENLEVFKSCDGISWAEANLLPLLKPVEQSWQPQDLLPDAASEEFLEEVKEIKERAAELPDEILVCLVGNMVTEEALPTYMTVANTVDGFRDETGASPTPWATWTRSWGAEEKRHGDLLNKYLYLSGRVDMRQIEKTIQYLIGSGMNSRTDKNPYCGAVYTSFQERATFISHCNTARHAERHGDAALARICGAIAGDEKRHEAGYTRLTEMLFEVEPDAAMLAFADMMRRRVAMPALLMYDGRDEELFRHFAAVSQRLGVYTSRDYEDMVEYFVRRWRVEERSRGLSPEGRRAQEYLCGLADRFRKAEEKKKKKKKKGDNNNNMVQFSWIFNRSVLA